MNRKELLELVGREYPGNKWWQMFAAEFPIPTTYADDEELLDILAAWIDEQLGGPAFGADGYFRQ